MEQEQMITYLFHRAEGFYPVELRHDKDAMECVELNPGTLKVERVNNDATTTVLFPN